MKPLAIIVAGDKWKLHLNSRSAHNFGLCDAAKKKIHVSKELTGREFIRYLIHEVVHGQQWHLEEEFVDAVSEELADILTIPEVQERF